MSHSPSPAVHALRWTTAGESHGPCLVAILEGLPAAMPIDWEAVREGMRRRWKGYGRGPRSKFEKDVLEVLGGMKNGVTLGTPLAVSVGNSDTRIDTLPNLKAPRPGHADLGGAMRSKTRDLRAVLERASARETAARTAIGEVCRQLLAKFGITVQAETLEIGGTPRGDDPETPAWNETIKAAHERGDSLGGVFQVRVEGCPPGLGGLEQPVDRLDARLMAALASIPAIRGVEIGLGFGGAGTPGSEYHDGIVPQVDGWAGVGRSSNRCGGIEGGLTNGQPIVLRAVMKPIPTMRRGAASVQMATLEESRATYERSDVCSVQPASVVGEIVVCLELASALRARLGGWTMAEMRERFAQLGRDERLCDWPEELNGRS
jgi:chorismate synthase